MNYQKVCTLFLFLDYLGISN